MEQTPLISCLCITHNSLKQLERSINCFKAQTYPNKELVVVYESENSYLKIFLQELNEENIITHQLNTIPKLTLGQLRNIAIERCNGDYFCQWDDDDWYSSKRLETQMEAMMENNKPASMLLYWLMYDSTRETVYLSPFRLWEGSILCKKSLISADCNYANLVKGEDTILLGKLIETNSIFPIIKPNLYIYVYHGKNTWDYGHFNHYFNKSVQLSSNASELVKDILDEKYSVDEATNLLSSYPFLEEISFRFELVDQYSIKMI